MASTISCFGYIRSKEKNETPSTPAFNWDPIDSIGSNVARIKCPYTQLRVLLEQSLAVAYYLKFYGSRCHEVVNDFVEELNRDICIRFASRYNKTFTDNYQLIYNSLMSLVKFNRGGNWVDLDVNMILEYLFDGNKIEGVPVVWTSDEKGYVAAFLLFMNRKRSTEHEQITYNEIGVTTFGLSNMDWDSGAINVQPFHHSVSTTYISANTPIDELSRDVASLAFLSHFDFTKCTFEGAVGVLAQFCFHKDITKFGLSESHTLGYLFANGISMQAVLQNNIEVRGMEPTLRARHLFDKDTFFVALVNFVKFCTTSRNMKFVDKDFIANAFGCLAESKKNRDSVDYLRRVNAIPSADMYNAFQETMGSCESLVLISQKPTLMTAQTGNQATVSTEATDGGNDNKDGAKPETQQPETQSADNQDNQPGEPGKSNDDDTSKPSTDDDGADDLPSDDTTGEEDAGNPAQPDDGSEPGGSSDPGSSDNSSAQPETTPEQTNTSDDIGIKFEIVPPDSSTVDSVIFREEMYKFLSNVLTNPPKCMSPQDIETLNALRKFWLSCLSIDTIKGIVEACIRLPKSIKNSIRKSTEQKQ